MRLKELEMHGFKSFPDKTVLQFDHGFTAVVGPNGSGKSNISDAVRWVLGEQSSKTLRGSKMEDVIFTGTQKRKSLGYARVSLTFDNSDRSLPYDEDTVTVTRKYYRSGDSEYSVNQKPVRLKDVQQMFMDTGLGKDGYSVVGQGKISEIVSAKSAERREIFEEAAGIAKFRYRKNEAERSLRNAEENLLRLTDILNELESRVEPLRKQSEKAEEFLRLSEEKRSLEITLWMLQLDKAKEMLRKQEEQYALSKREYGELSDAIEETEQKLERNYKNAQALKEGTERLRQQKAEVESARATRAADRAVLENDISHHRQSIEKLDENLSDAAAAGQKLEQEEAELEARRQALTESTAMLAEEIAQIESVILHLHSKSEEDSSRTATLTEQLNQCAVNAANFGAVQLAEEAAAKEQGEQLRRLDEELAAFKQQETNLHTELDEAHSLHQQLNEKKQALHNSAEGYRLKLESKQQNTSRLQSAAADLEWQLKEKHQRAALLADLEQSMEGFAHSVKFVMKAAQTGALRGIFGTVAQLISVDSKYALAVETALGGAMQNLVVENEAAAKAAIRYLKEHNAGRATFLPLTTVRRRFSKTYSGNDIGFIAMANELVQTDAAYRSMIDSLLGNIVVAEDLNSASEIAKSQRYQIKVVTLDGQVINAGGSFTGGSRAKNTGILSRKNERALLEEQAKELEQKLSASKEKAAAANDELQRLQAEYTAIQGEEQTVGEDIIRTEGETRRLDEQLAVLLRQIEQCETSKQEVKQKQTDHLAEAKQSAAQMEECKKQQENLQAQLQEADAAQQAVQTERDQTAEHLSELRIRQTELQKDEERLNADRDALTQRLSDAASQKNSWESERTALYALIASIRNQLSGFDLQDKQAVAQIDALGCAIEEQAHKVLTLEGEATSLREESKQTTARREVVSREMVRLEEQTAQQQSTYDSIIGKLWEEYQLTRSEADALRVTTDHPEQLQSKVSTLRSRIKALGSVNVAAIEEYKEVSERHRFLSAQVADVERSKQELNRLIRELTHSMTDLFTDSFHQINRHFGEIFSDLFGGGTASLSLTDPENVLESGIDIHVQPPGKIIRNLSALSGGEQSFVAIAIYFAILRVRPAPFCVLDEIEAALDDVNVNKFAEYLRQMCGNTQFIVITHRRGTMEAADVLYGVTMQEEGVSRLLTLPVSELASRGYIEE